MQRPCRKRPRQEERHEQHPPHLFLRTHLSLLRALHADDATAVGADSADSSCPRPSWVEVHNFLLLQASIMNRERKTRRTKRVLEALMVGGVVPTATANTAAAAAGTTAPVLPLSQVGIPPPSPSRQQQRRQRESRIDETTRPLDPRSVVSAVLRRAMKDREAEHVTGTAGLRGLRKGVDDTVDHLASSLDRLRRSRRNRAKPWRSGGREEEEQGAHSADVIERHSTKLLLWLRLQAAITASRVGVVIDDEWQQRGNAAES